MYVSKRLYVWIGYSWILYLYLNIFCGYIYIFIFIFTVLLYTHLSVQTAGNPGITEDLLAYFSAVITFCRTGPFPWKCRFLGPHATLKAWCPFAVPEGATLLDLHKDLADKPFPAWFVKEPGWESQQPFSWAMTAPDMAPWGQVTHLAELVPELGSVLCLCTVSSSLCLCKVWQCTAQVPSWATVRHPEYFHFDSHLENLTFSDDFFSPRKGKHEKPVASGSPLSFFVAFPPWKYLGWWRFAPRSLSLYFLLENISAFSCLLQLISLEGIHLL